MVVDGNAGTLRQQRQDPSLECDNMDDNFDDGDDISDRVWGVIEDGEKGEVRRPEELAQPADCAQGREETCGRNHSHKYALALLVDIVIIAAKRSAPGVEAEQS